MVIKFDLYAPFKQTNMEFNYREKSDAQLKANFYKRNSNNQNGFIDYNDFSSWYASKEKVCYYCYISEIEVQEIVVSGKLTSKRFPQNGINGQGTSRGMWLEVDRVNPNGLYSRDNSVLCCYFCNNDKSDVFSGKEYIDFFQNRITQYNLQIE